MNLPGWAKKEFTSMELESIEKAVKLAEKKTSGELVPMIVHRSSTIGHVPVLVLCLLTVVYFALDIPHWHTEYFGEHWGWYIFDILFIGSLTTFFSRLPWVQRHLISKNDKSDQVQMRAELEFYESNIKSTQESTGVLLFVSILERRAVVLADSAINNKVKPEVWSIVCAKLISGLKSGSVSQGFCEAIKECESILTPHFPIQEGDINELQDHLIIKD